MHREVKKVYKLQGKVEKLELKSEKQGVMVWTKFRWFR